MLLSRIWPLCRRFVVQAPLLAPFRKLDLRACWWLLASRFSVCVCGTSSCSLASSRGCSRGFGLSSREGCRDRLAVGRNISTNQGCESAQVGERACLHDKNVTPDHDADRQGEVIQDRERSCHTFIVGSSVVQGAQSSEAKRSPHRRRFGANAALRPLSMPLQSTRPRRGAHFCSSPCAKTVPLVTWLLWQASGVLCRVSPCLHASCHMQSLVLPMESLW